MFARAVAGLVKFFAASAAAFVPAAGFSALLAKRLRDDDYPGWEAFAYSLCAYAVIGQAWWRWLLRTTLGVSPVGNKLFLALAACASFFFAVFLGEFIAITQPARITLRFRGQRIALAVLAVLGTAVLLDASLLHSPLSRGLRRALRPGRAAPTAAGGAPAPKPG